MHVIYDPIGEIHSPFTETIGMPIQPWAARGIQGQIVVYRQYTPGLRDLDGFSHIILLYHFHKISEMKLEVTPFLDTRTHGVFSTRAPSRPNSIGLSIVKLMRIESNVVHIEDVDILDGTPLLDIKPYVPDFDQVQDVTIGWLGEKRGGIKNTRADDRFR